MCVISNIMAFYDLIDIGFPRQRHRVRHDTLVASYAPPLVMGRVATNVDDPIERYLIVERVNSNQSRIA